MKKNERIKFLLIGFFMAIVITFLLGAKNFNTDSEVGRYQVSGGGGDANIYVIMIDTKTGDFIEGFRGFTGKIIYKGNFQNEFQMATEK